MDKEFFHSFEHGYIQNTAIFLHLEDTFSIWVNLFMGKCIFQMQKNGGLFVIIFCVLVIFKEVVNTLKLDI